MAKAVNEAPFALVDRDDLTPLCPHCGERVEEIYRRSTGVALGQGKTTVYFCSTCHRILGFSQGRMI